MTDRRLALVQQCVTAISTARPAKNAQPAVGTPVYDALVTEYRLALRTVPGDRTGERLGDPGQNSTSGALVHRAAHRSGAAAADTA